MGLVLRDAEITKAGSCQYRHKVPKEVSAIITKRELGDSEREAIAAYPWYHAEMKKEIDGERDPTGEPHDSSSVEVRASDFSDKFVARSLTSARMAK